MTHFKTPDITLAAAPNKYLFQMSRYIAAMRQFWTGLFSRQILN